MKIFSNFFFFLYFVIYAVSPISAALPGEQSSEVSEQQAVSSKTTFPFFEAAPFEVSPRVEVQKCDQVDPLVFDMALWEILKKGRPSGGTEKMEVAVTKICPKNSFEKAKCGIAAGNEYIASPFYYAASMDPEVQAPCHFNITLSYSGLSPPSA